MSCKYGKNSEGENYERVHVEVDQTDPTTGSLKILEYGHTEIHSGDRFGSRSYELLPRNSVKYLLIVTPDTPRWAHLTVVVGSSDGPITAEFSIGATYSSPGTLARQGNRNMNSSKLPTTILYEDPVIIDEGTLLFDYYIGSGNKVGGTTRDEEELVLAQNASYLIRLENMGTVETYIDWGIDWYEHTNKTPIT